MYQECFKSFAIKQSLTEDDVREIEKLTKGQSENPLWFYHRVGCITASKFGDVNVRRRTTPPDKIIKEIIKYQTNENPEKRRRVPAMMHGYVTEEKARKAYIDHKEMTGCLVVVGSFGLFVASSYPWCGASPDGLVCDPSSNESLGLLEIKCPYSEEV